MRECPQAQKGGKSKGKGGYMPPKQWSGYNPGIFRPNQWRDWRPGNEKGAWGGKGKSKGINGMMMENGSDAFPAVLGAVTSEYGYYDSLNDYDGWGSQEQEEWPTSRPIGAVMRGTGNQEDPGTDVTNAEHEIENCFTEVTSK